MQGSGTAPLPIEPRPEVDLSTTTLLVIRRQIGLILFLLITISLYFAKEVLLPILLGLLLALTLSPMSRALTRLGVAPPVTAFVLIVLVGLGTASGAYMMSGPVSSWINEAPAIGQKLRLRLSDLSSSVQAVKDASDQVTKFTSEGTTQSVNIAAPGILTSAVSNIASVFTTLLVTLLLAFFLLASGDMFYIKLVEAFPKFGDKKRALRIVYGIERSVSRYLLSITIINAALGLVIGLGLMAVGMPQPAIWGVLAFLLNFLPYIGPMAGVALVAAASLVQFPQLSYALIAPAIYIVAAGIEGQLITPYVLGRRLELNTVSVFLTVVFWAWLWGIAGALMAVPFLVSLKVMCDNVERLETLGNFLSAPTRPEVEEALRGNV